MLAVCGVDARGRAYIGNMGYDLFGGAPELGSVAFEHGADQPGELFDLVGVEVLHQSEVDEGHPAVGGEQIVAGVRVAVEGVLPVEATEHEPVEDLGDAVAVVLRQVEGALEAVSVDELDGGVSVGRVRRLFGLGVARRSGTRAT